MPLKQFFSLGLTGFYLFCTPVLAVMMFINEEKYLELKNERLFFVTRIESLEAQVDMLKSAQLIASKTNITKLPDPNFMLFDSTLIFSIGIVLVCCCAYVIYVNYGSGSGGGPSISFDEISDSSSSASTSFTLSSYSTPDFIFRGDKLYEFSAGNGVDIGPHYALIADAATAITTVNSWIYYSILLIGISLCLLFSVTFYHN